eukprot:6026440-Pyramimonas_sp.AAC.1
MSEKVRATPLRGQTSGWWTQLNALLGGLSLHKTKDNGALQIERYVAGCARHLADRPEHVQRVLNGARGPPRSEWGEVLSGAG